MTSTRIVSIAFVAACGADSGSLDVDNPSQACVERAPNAFRTRFEGTGFLTFDSVTVHVVTTIGLADGSAITCRAASRAMIVDGAFAARADNRRDDAVYPRLGAFLDVDGDGACTAAVDPVWTTLSIAPPPDQEDTVMLVPDQLALRPEDEGCALLR